MRRPDPLVKTNSLGPAAGYVHEQTIASTIWSIRHTLAKFPTVVILDGSGNLVTGVISYSSKSLLLLTFNSAIAGTAYLS